MVTCPRAAGGIDGTGVALIRFAIDHSRATRGVEGIDLRLTTNLELPAGQPTAHTDQRVLAFLAERKIERRASMRHFMCIESRLVDGDFVVVYGRAQFVPDNDPRHVDQYRELPKRIAIFGSAADPMLITNDKNLYERKMSK